MLRLKERLIQWVVRVRCLPRPVKVAILAVLGLLAASGVAFAIYQLTGSGEALCAPYDTCRPGAVDILNVRRVKARCRPKG